MVKDNNIATWISIIALVVSIVAIAVVMKGGVTGNATAGNLTIKANSCDRDGICEIKTANVSNSILVKNSITVGGNTQDTRYGYTIITWVDGIVTNRLRMTNLGFNDSISTAYACITPDGSLVKKSTPCA